MRRGNGSPKLVIRVRIHFSSFRSEFTVDFGVTLHNCRKRGRELQRVLPVVEYSRSRPVNVSL